MEVLEIILGVILAVLAIVIIGLVLLQQSRRAGVNGAVSGAADTFLSKNNSRTRDAFLKRLTAICAILFGILALAATVVGTIIFKKG